MVRKQTRSARFPSRNATTTCAKVTNWAKTRLKKVTLAGCAEFLARTTVTYLLHLVWETIKGA